MDPLFVVQPPHWYQSHKSQLLSVKQLPAANYIQLPVLLQHAVNEAMIGGGSHTKITVFVVLPADSGQQYTIHTPAPEIENQTTRNEQPTSETGMSVLSGLCTFLCFVSN